MAHAVAAAGTVMVYLGVRSNRPYGGSMMIPHACGSSRALLGGMGRILRARALGPMRVISGRRVRALCTVARRRFVRRTRIRPPEGMTRRGMARWRGGGRMGRCNEGREVWREIFED